MELMETAFQTDLLPKYELRKNSTRNSDCMEDSAQSLSGLLTSFADFDRQWMGLGLSFPFAEPMFMRKLLRA